MKGLRDTGNRTSLTSNVIFGVGEPFNSASGEPHADVMHSTKLPSEGGD